MKAGAIAATTVTATSLNGQGSPNLIMNGDFEVAQRGATFAAATAYTLDGYTFGQGTDGVVTVTQDTDVPTLSQSGHLSRHSIKVQVTTADSTIAAGQYAYLAQPIEGYDLYPTSGKTVTLSFWVKAKKTGVYCVALQNSGASRTYVAECTISSADTWEKKTITLTMNATGVWNYTTGVGVYFLFMLACGSTYQTTKDVWQTGQYMATSSQVNAMDSTNNYVSIAQLKFEIGAAATPFVPVPYQQELARCQRRLCVIKALGARSYPVAGTGTAFSATGAQILIPLPVTMPSEPLLTFSGAWIVTDEKVNKDYASYDGSVYGHTPNGISIAVTSSGAGSLTQGFGAALIGTTNASYLIVSCEL